MNAFFDFKIMSIKDTQDIVKKTSGKNKKKLLVVINEKDDTSELNLLLDKILKAAGFDIEQDGLLLKLTEKDGFSLTAFYVNVEVESIISFGFKPTFLGMDWSLPSYQPYTFQARKYLFVNALSDIAQNLKLKGMLWKNLQEMFLK